MCQEYFSVATIVGLADESISFVFACGSWPPRGVPPQVERKYNFRNSDINRWIRSAEIPINLTELLVLPRVTFGPPVLELQPRTSSEGKDRSYTHLLAQALFTQ